MKKAHEITAEDLHDRHQSTTIEKAEKYAVEKDQVWTGEGYTKYMFDDGSAIVVTGPASYAVDYDDIGQVNYFAHIVLDRDEGLSVRDYQNLMRSF